MASVWTWPWKRWVSEDISITTGLVSATTTPMLLMLLDQGKIKPEEFVTHRFKRDEMMEAYDIFARAAGTRSVKVAISR